MKVGVLTLTFQSNDNYGAYLQAWALKTAIKKYTKADAVVLPIELNRQERWIEKKIQTKIKSRKKFKFPLMARLYYLLSLANAARKKCNHGNNTNLREEARIRAFQNFLNLFCSDGRPHFIDYTLKENSRDINTFVIGSDWVWFLPDFMLNADITAIQEHWRSLYLGFFPLAPEQKRITYAASQGIIPCNYSALLKSACNNFSAISVRESESAQYLRSLKINQQISVVLDPTLLLDRDDIKPIEKHIDDQGYIAVYALPAQNLQILSRYIENLHQKTNKKVVILNKSNEFSCSNFPVAGDILGPSEFVSYIKHADYVITNSFHGMVFSMLFRRPFTAFQRQNRDFRQINFCRILNLEERLLKPTSPAKFDPFDRPIDWNKVEQLHRSAMQSSIQFLQENIV